MAEILFSSWGGDVVDNRGKEPQEYETVKNVSLPEYFQQDEEINALMGWYGIVLRSSEVNIVDLCRSYMEAVQEKSCGKCFLCRIGTKVIADTLGRLCNGKGRQADLEIMARLAESISESSKCNIGQSGPVPLRHALEYFADEFAQAAQGKSVSPGVYRSKLTAPCMDACPIHLDIPTYVECIREGKFQESLEVIRERLPLPGVVGRVCVRPCEDHCRRANLDEPVSIKFLKRFVADHELGKGKEPGYLVEPAAKTGTVAIVGAGPAGVTCAYHLARKGHQVTIYEKLGEPGGMSAVGIPDYRLPRHILRGEVEQVQKMGVTINYNTEVGKDVKLSQLEADYDVVFIGHGAHLSASMRVDGEDAGYKGFITGVQYLLDINSGIDPYPEGNKVVVVGGGNVAIDCVRCSFRMNKKDVNLVYRRTEKEMPADDVEIHDAHEEEVTFHYLTHPVKVLAENGKVVGLECIKMQLGEPDESGRQRPEPVEGSEFILDCDIVVPAIGQTIDLSMLEGVDKVKTTRWHTLVVNEDTKQTDNPKIFSAGDCETGPGALITACAGGRTAAINIDKYINGEPLVTTEDDYFDKLFDAVKVYDKGEDVGFLGGRQRYQLGMLPPETRKWTFDEVEQGFSPQEAMAEADRCLRCYRVATIATAKKA
ncbi:MAG: FAD-dependent oxidoreductase [Deltaproteobacteria bacterium]|nr:FAD-dependent oxidoreductase [Candidatus Anaeroferrophillus wilburensis]MBN2889215.1 FAD-dependent oxidoreductase [Deltaproteobacteria bacterium]